jgi:transcriptional regulator with XRE-family HTH domain
MEFERKSLELKRKSRGNFLKSGKSKMMDLNDTVFVNLFREVCQKCFGHPVTEPLSETDSKLLVNNIFEQTGLVIGVKSIKNYSQYIFGRGGKKENPSIATLDTLARFILNAPYTDEVQRKKNESHHPYWFQYKSGFSNTISKTRKPVSWKKIAIAVSIVLFPVIAVLLLSDAIQLNSKMHLTEDFNSVNGDSLAIKGWVVKNTDIAYWNRRDKNAGHLSLYTLKGDNWPDVKHTPGIRNLLIRRISSDCFTAEIHLTAFFPKQNWQQAGILLSEDSTFTGKALRLSISYNNFFGGYDKPAEIIIQVVGSSESGNLSKPEEIAHIPLFSIEPGKGDLIADNLFKSALKIEKKDNHYRFLYTNGRMESFAFKEAAGGDYNIRPKYIGLFAMQGFSDTEDPMPVLFDSFSLSDIDCNR